MDVVVTGGNGSIGRFVVEELAARDHDVTVFDVQSGSLPDGVSFRKGDVTDAEDVSEAIAGTDAVVHLAAVLPPDSEDRPALAQRVNIGGTVNILNAVQQADARAIVASSKAVFGQVAAENAYPDYEPLSEDVPKRPMNVYGLTNLACEQFCRDYANNRDVDVACVRFASTYGPGKVDEYGDHSDHGDVTLVSRLIEVDAGESITVPGGDERNDFLYYADIGNGIADAVEAPELTHHSYNLGTGRLLTLRDFAAAMRERRPEADITVEDGLDPYDRDHPRYCRMDISRARADLGYEPAFSLEEAIDDYLDRLGG